MYFYNSLLLIINILILTIHIQSQKQKGPGISGCNYMGGSSCAEAAKINQIPDECSSLMFFSLVVDLKYRISADYCSNSDSENYMAYLDTLLSSGKRIYVYYGHSTQQEWTQMLCCEDSNGGINSLDEMNSLKTFMGIHKGISGLILINFENNDYSKAFPKYSEKLKIYLETMKNSFPDLEIGIELYGNDLIDQYTNQKLPWLDFKTIDPYFDFYIIDMWCLNACTPELVDIGIAPINSSKANYTMDKVLSVIQQAKIPKEKTYYGFRLGPYPVSFDTVGTCDLNIQKMCLDKNSTSDWCMENMTSFHEKGQFSKKNGMGFVTSGIALNDPKNQCKCEKPFASFYALLDGFNDAPSSKPCALL